MSFQSVLGEVIDEFNNYFESLQGKFLRFIRIFINRILFIRFVENQTAATAQLEKSIRHQVRLFQIDIVCLQSQIEQSNSYVVEQLRSREDQQQLM